MDTLANKLAVVEGRGVDPDLIQRLAALIERSRDPELVKLSPFRLADTWQRDRFEVLDAFLHATRAGIFDLEWDLRCPSCTGSTHLAGHLDQLGQISRCEYCELDFEAGFDDVVEVTFRVNPDVRAIGELVFTDVMVARSVFEPPRTVRVAPGEEHAFELDLPDGAHHFYSADFELAQPLRIAGPRIEARRELIYTVRPDPVRGRVLEKNLREFAPGPAQVRLVNRSDAPCELMFTRAIDQPWVSGAIVASNQAFRDLFTHELIARDESFAVRSMSFVFTDIRGSTELYERLGDSGAYALVREHFRILGRVVNAHRGGIVKTIGDAVMATFPVARDATDAVFEMHRAFEQYNRDEVDRDDIVIKVGVHRGPCLAVTSNDRIDYFGRTVNMAARIQGLSAGGDIMVSAAQLADPVTEARVRASAWARRAFRASLKGIDQPADLVQLTQV